MKNKKETKGVHYTKETGIRSHAIFLLIMFEAVVRHHPHTRYLKYFYFRALTFSSFSFFLNHGSFNFYSFILFNIPS